MLSWLCEWFKPDTDGGDWLLDVALTGLSTVATMLQGVVKGPAAAPDALLREALGMLWLWLYAVPARGG